MDEQRSAVVLFFYNRPDHLRQVLEQIIRSEPKALYLVSDGPKSSLDKADIQACRSIVDATPCPFPVFHKYADHNLGVARSIPEGLDWVFSREAKAIILEDDVIPEPDFFSFMEKMLVDYRNDPRIDLIMGHQLADLALPDHYYFFTRFCLPPWGWATWAANWNTYDFHMRAWPDCRETLRDVAGLDMAFWSPILNRNQHQPRSWDIQWNFWLWYRQTMAVVPARSLTTNIGFGPKATFTRWPHSGFARPATITDSAIPWQLAERAERLPFDHLLQQQIQTLIREVMSGKGRAPSDK